MRCSVQQRSAAICCALQCSAVPYRAPQCSSELYSALLCSAVLFSDKIPSRKRAEHGDSLDFDGADSAFTPWVDHGYNTPACCRRADGFG